MSWSIGSGLEGKGVVVTGAARGIGREVAVAFAQSGARVACVDLEAEAPAATVASLEEPKRHLALSGDLRHIREHERLLETAIQQFGRLDILAHVAGVLVRRQNVDEVTEEDWDLQHDVNLKATFFLNRSMGRRLRAQARGGRIINFASQAWWSGGFGGSVAYAATKGGVVSLTRGLARTYAKDRITVNAVSPGAIDTPMMRSGLSKDQLHEQVSQIPMGCIGSPQDVVGAVLFLASDHASYITGATINVSGGWLMY
jgi:NAD(P)-dependent dehydrogenase (short-subunit alcohol dehydrogenase family)